MTANDQNKDDQNAATASEDMKEKFRKALENKKNQHHGSVEAAGGAKISSSHGAASQKREFRRKSG